MTKRPVWSTQNDVQASLPGAGLQEALEEIQTRLATSTSISTVSSSCLGAFPKKDGGCHLFLCRSEPLILRNSMGRIAATVQVMLLVACYKMGADRQRVSSGVLQCLRLLENCVDVQGIFTVALCCFRGSTVVAMCSVYAEACRRAWRQQLLYQQLRSRQLFGSRSLRLVAKINLDRIGQRIPSGGLPIAAVV